ncbi:MAG: enoyl-CoA hydratase [Rhodocyclales bacterium]|nr:enoyl-CoA hydratase [Rhodocyclales bacterium]
MSFVLIDKPWPQVTRITLNRPERMNAMGLEMMIELRQTLETLSDDPGCRVIVMTGAGAAFCAGADLQGGAPLPMMAGLGKSAWSRRAFGILEDAARTLRKTRQPVIAAVNGPAIGGGFCLAMACDIRLAGESACFRAGGINIGLMSAELGLSYVLPRAIGASRSFEIMLSGRDVKADEADRIGIVSRTVTDALLMTETLQLAERIVAFSALSVELTKQMLWDGLDASSFESQMNHEGHAQLYVSMTTRNFEEAIAARREKRQPQFKD